VFLYIIPFENLDQFILKFGFIYLTTKLNVLSSIDATRWKLVFYIIKIRFHIAFIRQFLTMGCILGGKSFEQFDFFYDVKPSAGEEGEKYTHFKKSPLYTILGGLFVFSPFFSPFSPFFPLRCYYIYLFYCTFFPLFPLPYHLSIIIIFLLFV
jgi:hypothetical protein